MNQGASEAVEAVRFSFMTDEEVRRHSVVKVTSPNLLDTIGKPVPNGLYDLAMGPLDDRSPCKSCGHCVCSGQCSHIELVSPVYNPLLFNMLHNLLQRTCFDCFHFRASRAEVEKCVSELELIAKGDVVGAKTMDALSPDNSTDREESEGSHMSCTMDDLNMQDHCEYNKRPFWDNFQFNEAMTQNPKINKPSFGRFHIDISDKKIRENYINRGHRFNLHFTGGSEENPSPEVVNATESLREAETSLCVTSSKGLENSKAHGGQGGNQSDVIEQQQKDSFSVAHLPSQVRNIIEHLWENEAPLCTFFCDIQRQYRNMPGKVAGPSMFFLDSILVPPIKFCPPAKGGDSVMEHPHTVLLGKVVQSNIALGNAHINRAGRSKIISRLMDLQGPGQKDVGTGICQLLEKKEGIFRQKMMGKRVNFACQSVISPDPYLAVNERLTPWNAVKVRDAIINGPDNHPGAVSFADRISTMKLPSSKKMRVAISRKLPSSRGAVTQSGRNDEYEFEGKVVYWHLQDGDKMGILFLSIVSTYNADFDGDEMNVHFPQDEISRAEAYNIVNANEQYIVPTKRDTVRGLIQDHIVSAVILTMKNTFLTLHEFNQLLYGSGVFAAGHYPTSGNHSNKVSVVDSEGVVQTILPTAWKPEPLWTGKQVITALLNHLTNGCSPCTVKNKGKIPYPYFLSESRLVEYQSREEEEDRTTENNFLIWKNELVRGVIDKAQFGKFGLVHTIQELYGSNKAGILLSALSRLFTIFLQLHGFTCGIDDLVILPHYDIRRKEELEGEDVGEEAHCDFVKFKRGEIGPLELQLEIEKAISSNKEAATAALDMKMKNKLANKGSQFNKELLLKGLLKPFPRNCIALMTRARLVDTTVKTSRSGYLQRCLIKNLESLKVCYDYTVRDADGSIIQFYYGEDKLQSTEKSLLEEKAKKMEKKLEQLVKKEEILKLLKEEELNFLELVGQKYLSSLADSGEPVGVLAGQSVGEPSTQMTDDAQSLLAKVKKITVADMIESMEVNLLPLSIHDHQVSQLYKLTVKLKKHDFVSSEDCEGNGDHGNEEQTSKLQSTEEDISNAKTSKSKTKTIVKQKKKKERRSRKDSDRSVYIDVDGLHFEVHFRLVNEPHILLAQVAQKTAKKVYIKNSGKINQCRMVKYEVTENTVMWDEKQRKKQSQDTDSAYWALKAAGVDFGTFWEMQDDLDTVFGIYGVEIDYRHLSLIADFMTHTGGYQPMNRYGSISESLSPFLKMSFETASKFIVEASAHGLTDYLKTPSSRICLGLPVKMGTGCFDIMQKLDI
ncbi:unnamed protein product [Withania somnifera]